MTRISLPIALTFISRQAYGVRRDHPAIAQVKGRLARFQRKGVRVDKISCSSALGVQRLADEALESAARAGDAETASVLVALGAGQTGSEVMRGVVPALRVARERGHAEVVRIISSLAATPSWA